MKKNNLIILAIVLVVLFLFASCTAGTNPNIDVVNVEGELAGFWMGLWHGIIAPFTFLISLFEDSVMMYEVHNTGHWYDLGFVLGSGILFGGGIKTGTKKI
jgi:hypothetical protein